MLFFVGGNVGTKKAHQGTVLLFGVFTERGGANQKGVNQNFVFRSKNKSVASLRTYRHLAAKVGTSKIGGKQ